MAKRTVKILTVLFLIFLAFFILYARVIFQEGNPLPQLSGIIRLNFGKDKIVKLSTPNESYLTKSKTGRDELLKFMQEKNYRFVEQLGAGYVFETPAQERKIIVHRYYSRFYDLWKF